MFKNLYISNPQYWEKYLNQPPAPKKRKQRGTGIYKRAYMSPVSDDFIQHVSPVTAEVDRAKSRLEEKMKDGEPHMPLKRKSVDEMDEDEPHIPLQRGRLRRGFPL